jgi:hypothetical protein
VIHDTKQIRICIVRHKSNLFGVRICDHETIRIHGFAKQIHIFTNLLYTIPASLRILHKNDMHSNKCFKFSLNFLHKISKVVRLIFLIFIFAFYGCYLLRLYLKLPLLCHLCLPFHHRQPVMSRPKAFLWNFLKLRPSLVVGVSIPGK